jgi:hypothetical protein
VSYAFGSYLPRSTGSGPRNTPWPPPALPPAFRRTIGLAEHLCAGFYCARYATLFGLWHRSPPRGRGRSSQSISPRRRPNAWPLRRESTSKVASAWLQRWLCITVQCLSPTCDFVPTSFGRSTQPRPVRVSLGRYRKHAALSFEAFQVGSGLVNHPRADGSHGTYACARARRPAPLHPVRPTRPADPFGPQRPRQTQNGHRSRLHEGQSVPTEISQLIRRHESQTSVSHLRRFSTSHFDLHETACRVSACLRLSRSSRRGELESQCGMVDLSRRGL